MKLVAFTICLDGAPFLMRQMPIFRQLSIPWRWIVVEGASGNTADTSWCQPQKPRVSMDGTHEYLRALHQRDEITHIFQHHWPNKTAMCNAALAEIKEPCVLMQIDADEIWTAQQLEKIVLLFDDIPRLNSIMFACNYFVGPDLLLEGKNCYGDMFYEWRRAWHFTPGDYFRSHEPPILIMRRAAVRGPEMWKDQSRELGLVFNHLPYAYEAQVKYKEQFYGYKGLHKEWLALQAHDKFPVSLSRFFSHVSGELPKVVKVEK